MAFLSRSELELVGFKQLGENVKVSSTAMIYEPHKMELGDHSRIDDYCILSGKIHLGRNVHIAVFCNLAGGSEGIHLDDFSGLAYRCTVISQTDDYSGASMTNPTVPEKYKKEVKKAVYIGRHCIVGTNTLIFPGVHLAEGTSVGAMSMVTKSTEAWGVYFGIPAKRLKSRKKELLSLERIYLDENSSAEEAQP